MNTIMRKQEGIVNAIINSKMKGHAQANLIVAMAKFNCETELKEGKKYDIIRKETVKTGKYSFMNVYEIDGKYLKETDKFYVFSDTNKNEFKIAKTNVIAVYFR